MLKCRSNGIETTGVKEGAFDKGGSGRSLAQPFQGCGTRTRQTQGSLGPSRTGHCSATLGFEAESLWDSLEKDDYSEHSWNGEASGELLRDRVSKPPLRVSNTPTLRFHS